MLGTSHSGTDFVSPDKVVPTATRIRRPWSSERDDRAKKCKQKDSALREQLAGFGDLNLSDLYLLPATPPSSTPATRATRATARRSSWRSSQKESPEERRRRPSLLVESLDPRDGAIAIRLLD